MHWLTAQEIATGYREKRFSPTELCTHLLDRVEALDGLCNAFINIDRERVLAQARLAEQEIAAGKSRGPLHGVPVGVKDIIDVAGELTTCHSALMLDNLAKSDAFVISQLRGAGAILFGKLALHEFAIGGPSFDLPFPPARNPWNLNHHPGGSSSGSGSALAAGFVPLALGTDTGGSIRNPAGACGIVGLKPTYDLVSRRGLFPLSFTLDHIGPMARSVWDAGALLDVLAAPKRHPYKFSSLSRIDHGIKGLRVGFIRHIHQREMVADPEMATALEDASRLLRELGARVDDVELPLFTEMSATQKVIQMAEGWAVHARWLSARPEAYAQTSRRKLLGGAFLTAAEYVQAMQLRGTHIAAVDELLNQHDVLLCVNSMEPACQIDDPAELSRTYTRQARAVFNLTGHPVLALMTGLSKSGLPLSMQLVGRHDDESTVLQVGAAYEKATEWHRLHPQFA